MAKAIMPREYLMDDREFIRGMKVGQKGYTLPWAVGVTEKGEARIDSSYPLTLQPQGTSSLYVERREDGIYIDPSTSYRKWELGSASISSNNTPVAGFTAENPHDD